jgi:hypothetical protein
VHAVGDRAIIVEGCKYLSYRLKNTLQPIDIKKCLLLSCERGVGQILGRRRGPDRDRRVRGLREKLRVGTSDLLLERRKQGRFQDPATDLRAGARKRGDVVDIELAEHLIDARAQLRSIDEFAEGGGGRRETARDADAFGGEMSDHLAKRGILAADLRQIGHAELVEPHHSLLFSHPAVSLNHGREPDRALRQRQILAWRVHQRRNCVGRWPERPPMQDARQQGGGSKSGAAAVGALVGAGYVLGRTGLDLDTHEAVIGQHRRLTIGPLVLAAHGSAQAAVQIGMGFLEIADDFEVDALDLRQIDLLHMHESKQLAHGLRHLAPAFVSRAAALRDADLSPELLLVQSQTTSDLARVQDSIE